MQSKSVYFYMLLFFLLPDLLLTQSDDGNKLVKVDIYSDFIQVSPGMKFNLFVKLTPDKNWHTYWLNPGDAGLPTEVDLTLPDGVSSGVMLWETPEKIPFTGMANYGYEAQSTLMIPIKVDSNFALENIDFKMLVKWLVCKEECIPGSKQLEFSIPINSSPKANDAVVSEILKVKSNHALVNQNITANSVINDNLIRLELECDCFEDKIDNLNFFPFETGYLDNGADQQIIKEGNKIIVSMKLDKFREQNPKKIYGIIVSDKSLIKGLTNKSVEINLDI